jgi:hypothetical protein
MILKQKINENLIELTFTVSSTDDNLIKEAVKK